MRVTFALLALHLLAGCSAVGGGVGFTSSTGSSSGGTGGTSTGTGGGGLILDAGPVPDAGPMAPAEVYGQTSGTLYKLDPNTKVVTKVGDFPGCNGQSVIDIALDKDGNMFATTSASLFKVNKATAACTHIADGSYPNSLSFVPKGTLDPNVEALVGYVGAEYVRIDTTTGKVSNVGSLGNQGYVSSGDVVSVINGGTYLTVKGVGCGDCIVQVDPKTGALLKNIGPLKYGNVFGLAFWGGSAYGFSDSGPLFQIDLTNAHCTDIPIPNMPAGFIWFGAGSTTSAPLVPTQ